MIIRFKNVIKNILEKKGYCIKKTRDFKPVDYREICNDPRVALYNGSIFPPVIIEVDIIKGRTRLGYHLFIKDSIDPDMFALRNYIELKATDFIEKYVEKRKYYNGLHLKGNAAEAVGLTLPDNRQLSQYPFWCRVYPWSYIRIAERYKKYPEHIINNRKEKGLHINFKSNDDVEIFLKNERNLVSQAKQFYNLYRSIKQNGMMCNNNHDGYVTATIMFKNDEWTWQIGPEGNHRAKIASAIGMDKIPVRIVSIVRREDVSVWLMYSSIFNAKAHQQNNA